MPVKKTRDIMYTSLLLHNMILPDKGVKLSHMHQPDHPPPPNEGFINQELLHELLNVETYKQLLSYVFYYTRNTYIPYLDN